MTINFTENQQHAIDLTGTNLLISAAAGSGKTAVLVERILKQVINNNVNIDEFLVVTFTKLAASEMKEKIISQIQAKINDTCDKSHLEKQLDLINFAKINTVHAFCFEIIREFFSELNIDPDFKIISGTEEKLIKENIMQSVISDFFEKNDFNAGEFINFITAVNKKNIEKEMIDLYNFLLSYSKPFDVISNSLCFHEKILNITQIDELEQLIYGDDIKKNALDLISRSKKMALEAQAIISNFPESKNNFVISQDIELIETLEKSINNSGYIQTFELIKTCKFARMSPKGQVIEHFHNKIKNLRDKYKKIITEKAFYITPITIDECILQSETQIQNLNFINEIINDFHIRFEDFKKMKNVLVFSDAEHKMIELLEKEAICESIKTRFREIMIDEYQDTNEIQDTIFSKLANENRFMVGDLKQSIYRFRFAEPSIFTEKLELYSDNKESKSSRKVCLNNNFRSKNDVITSVNTIFDRIMTRELGGVDYNNNEQQLVFSAPYFRDDTKKSEFLLVDIDKINSKMNKQEIEGTVIADRISDLISSKIEIFDKGNYRKIEYKDIVILMRAVSSKAYFYKKAIENAGIPVDFESDVSSVFNTPEILALLTFLKVIDNNLDKNSLIAVLKSEIFGFSNNEILTIQNLTEHSFLQSMKFITENPVISDVDNKLRIKCNEILSFLSEISEYAKYHSVYFVLWKIISRFDIIAKFSLANFGEIRQKNIKMFLDFTETFGDDTSLYEFIETCDNIDSSTKLSQDTNSEGAVKIMSIHKSKGLEFPVVIVADMAKKFNELDKRADIVKSSSFGVATRHVEENGFVKYTPVIRDLINIRNDRESISEEMRILYVALTRAKEKLILVASKTKLCTGEQSSVINNWILDEGSVSSYLDWVAPSALKSKSATVFSDISSEISNFIDENDDNFDCFYIDKLEENFKQLTLSNDSCHEIFDYQIETKIDVPSKITPSAVQAFNRLNVITDENAVIYYKKPKFIEDKGLSPAQKGIAHHAVMQLIDLDFAYSVDDIKSELLRLLDQKFISKAQFDVVNPETIYKFFASDIGQKLKYCDVYREFNFSVLVSSAELLHTDSDGKVLFQGVIDCMYIDDGLMHIIDFKTDYIKSFEKMREATIHHKVQIDMYEKAILEIFKIPIGSKNLYYFSNEMFDQI